MIILNRKLKAARSTPEMIFKLSEDLLIEFSKSLNSGKYESLSFDIDLSNAIGRLETSLRTEEKKGSLSEEIRDNSNGIEISNKFINLVYYWMFSARQSRIGEQYLAPSLNVEFSRGATRDSIKLLTHLVKDNGVGWWKGIGVNIFGDGRRVNMSHPEDFRERYKQGLNCKVNQMYLDNVVIEFDGFLIDKEYVLKEETGAPKFYASPKEIIRLKEIDANWEK